MSQMTLSERVKEANKVLQAIASHGSMVFHSEVHNRVARFGLDRHYQVWYVDERSGMLIYPFGANPWPGFTHDALSKSFITALACYVKLGDKVPANWFADDLWGYCEDEMNAVRQLVMETDVMEGEPK